MVDSLHVCNQKRAIDELTGSVVGSYTHLSQIVLTHSVCATVNQRPGLDHVKHTALSVTFSLLTTFSRKFCVSFTCVCCLNSHKISKITLMCQLSQRVSATFCAYILTICV